MKSSLKKGDLVFVPSSVRLVQFNHDMPVHDATESTFVQKHTVTSKPSHALLLDSINNYCKIYYNGECWFASEEDIYGGEE